MGTLKRSLCGTKGFTLIELMIVVAIVAILAAIAYPSYLEQIRKGRRTDARTALVDFAARQERFMSTNNTYATTPDNLGYAGTAFPVDVSSDGAVYYRITVNATATTFAATAQPVNAQSSDRCGSYTLSHLGVRGNTGNTLASNTCW
jgi:type IV pilus assembly protein PilE